MLNGTLFPHYSQQKFNPRAARTRGRIAGDYALLLPHHWYTEASVSVGCSLAVPGDYSVSVSVALLLARLESVTPLGAVTLAVSESVPVADELIVPFAL